jgi:hypothetical protein
MMMAAGQEVNQNFANLPGLTTFDPWVGFLICLGLNIMIFE